MWRLPQLVWQDSAWQLPLTVRAAHELVLALLDEPDACRGRLEQLLPHEPELLLWIVCQATAWRSDPPENAAAPANWLRSVAIPAGLFWVEPAGNAPAPSDAFGLLSAYGPAATVESLRGCPWFPLWLFPIERTQRLAIPPFAKCLFGESSTNDRCVAESDRALAQLLPQVLTKVRRLDELENQFSATLEREKIASLRELAYGASHEVNNPLANIATRAQALLRDETDPERKRKLATIAAQAFRAHEMISDMMLFAKPPSPVFQPVDAITVVRKVIGEMGPDAEAQQTQLLFDPPPDPQVVSADSTQLGVAVKALVRNALEALGAGGTVAVAVRQVQKVQAASADTASLEIVVRDSGPGIAPEVRRHLFDPFYSGREAGRGLGFGLSKCWRIAELHGGTIQVDSEPGFGATFTFRIPNERD